MRDGGQKGRNMKSLKEIMESKGLAIEDKGLDGLCGFFYVNGIHKKPMAFVASWGGGWEHVSVSFSGRTPTWEEMCKVKDTFWNDNECVIQYHPAKSEYVNNHPYCLHLWKKIGSEFETPPKAFV